MAALNPISGTIAFQDRRAHLKGDSHCPLYRAEAQNEEVSLSLPKLKGGDFITGTGELDSSSCTARIRSIDYVGLKRLLGYWYTKEGLLRISGFNSLDFYPFSSSQQEANIVSVKTGDPISYRYSVTPAAGKEWIVFLSDFKNTTFASLQVASKNATLKIYDSETGDTIHTLHLSKWGDLE